GRWPPGSARTDRARPWRSERSKSSETCRASGSARDHRRLDGTLSMYSSKHVSVVFPAYNEEESIRAAVEDFFATGVVDEVIVVDNNSRDRTVKEAARTKARLVREEAQGYGHALRRGLREAAGEIVILAEPDGTFIGRDVLKLLAYSEDFDMVC